MKPWSWVQFCVTATVMLLALMFAMTPFESLWVQLGVCGGGALIAGVLAGRFGDHAWNTIVNALRWLAQ